MTGTEWDRWWEEFDEVRREEECNRAMNPRWKKSDLSPEVETTLAKFMGER